MPGEDTAIGLCVGHLPGEQLERHAELLPQFVLPLLDQPARRDDQAALQVATEHQFLDVKPGHDRLARAGIVGEQEAERGSAQEFAVDGLDLVGERLQIGGMHREHRVETARHTDAQRLGGELERVGVCREVVCSPLDDIQAGLVIAVQDALVESRILRPEGKAQGVAANPCRGHHSHRRSAGDPDDLRARSYVLKPHRVLAFLGRDDSTGGH